MILRPRQRKGIDKKLEALNTRPICSRVEERVAKAAYVAEDSKGALALIPIGIAVFGLLASGKGVVEGVLGLNWAVLTLLSGALIPISYIVLVDHQKNVAAREVLKFRLDNIPDRVEGIRRVHTRRS
ncbi:hypothetical protein [Brachybacterium phenoliresistens]|uniref:hypothetical protein n=1 Tax=Brachybacterium phenoliresistens TaxID=396014 RepID=UPI0031D790E1